MTAVIIDRTYSIVNLQKLYDAPKLIILLLKSLEVFGRFGHT